jgi:nucleotide-binding universal stress UspA family protein
MTMFKKALVGVDQSPAEESLLSCLPDLGRWGIESLILAYVIRVGYGQGAGYGHENDFRAWLEKDAGPLRDAGLEVTTSITASGAPADELLILARAEAADLRRRLPPTLISGAAREDEFHCRSCSRPRWRPHDPLRLQRA